MGHRDGRPQALSPCMAAPLPTTPGVPEHSVVCLPGWEGCWNEASWPARNAQPRPLEPRSDEPGVPWDILPHSPRPPHMPPVSPAQYWLREGSSDPEDRPGSSSGPYSSLPERTDFSHPRGSPPHPCPRAHHRPVVVADGNAGASWVPQTLGRVLWTVPTHLLTLAPWDCLCWCDSLIIAF